jgi:hypothetical protein
MRKQRTRQHIIEDLSFNHIEKQILKKTRKVSQKLINLYGFISPCIKSLIRKLLSLCVKSKNYDYFKSI